eukprot:Clim_evm78s142 gene=Clim_evmTU78s142
MSAATENGATGVAIDDSAFGAEGSCKMCNMEFKEDEQRLMASGQFYHYSCYRCVECLTAFGENSYFEYEGHLYCERDYHLLYGPRCHRCKENITGRSLIAMGEYWHPDHFQCTNCETSLAGKNFLALGDRALCKECYKQKLVESKKHEMCQRCGKPVIGSDFLMVGGKKMHPQHFNCSTCGITLNSLAKELGGRLYCPTDFEKAQVMVCGACRKPIVSARWVTALGKTWHVDHLVCATCEDVIGLSKFFEYGNMAYCEYHYKAKFADTCWLSGQPIMSDTVKVMGKKFDSDNFMCFGCRISLNEPDVGVIDVDRRPYCKNCYTSFPLAVKKRLKKYTEYEKLVEKEKGSVY